MLPSQLVHGTLDGQLIQGHNRFAVAFLVAGANEGIKREWVLIGSRDLLLDQAADDAGFQSIELDFHVCMIVCTRVRCIVWLVSDRLFGATRKLTAVAIMRVHSGRIDRDSMNA